MQQHCMKTSYGRDNKDRRKVWSGDTEKKREEKVKEIEQKLLDLNLFGFRHFSLSSNPPVELSIFLWGIDYTTLHALYAFLLVEKVIEPQNYCSNHAIAANLPSWNVDTI